MLQSTKTPLLTLALLLAPTLAYAAEPLHQRIDRLILAKAEGKPAAAVADDAEFLRRVHLDLAGQIPSVQQARAFLADRSADKRGKVIDQLLASPDYARRMQEQFHVMLMERLGDHAEWSKYLHASFEANRPWDQMVREILAADPKNDAAKGAAFFYAKRLEHYGQNAVDYPGLTRDVGRLFLGMDLQCAQCHNHRFIKEYRQEDFQGLYAIFLNASLVDLKSPEVAEKVMTKKLAFSSVFNKTPKETGPRIPGGKEIDIPVMKKGEEFVVPPDPKKKLPGIPKFSPLAKLAEQLPTAENRSFVKNGVNRIWFLMMGRGIVHPLDMHHSDNPPSHPELLDALADEFVAHKFDIKWLLREIALSQAYQRSSLLPEGQDKVMPETFLVGLEKRLSAEQLLASMLEATGERASKDKAGIEALRAKFVKAFANPAREPEDDFAPSLKATLFLLNDDAVLGLLTPKSGNLVERLARLPDHQVAEELYLSVLTRLPSAEEKADVGKYLTKHATRKPTAVGHLAWALLASSEFAANH
jgi:hypothetical protein